MLIVINMLNMKRFPLPSVLLDCCANNMYQGHSASRVTTRLSSTLRKEKQSPSCALKYFYLVWIGRVDRIISTLDVRVFISRHNLHDYSEIAWYYYAIIKSWIDIASCVFRIFRRSSRISISCKILRGIINFCEWRSNYRWVIEMKRRETSAIGRERRFTIKVSNLSFNYSL